MSKRIRVPIPPKTLFMESDGGWETRSTLTIRFGIQSTMSSASTLNNTSTLRHT